MTEPCDLSTLTDGQVADLVANLAPHAPRDVNEDAARHQWAAIEAAQAPPAREVLLGCLRWPDMSSVGRGTDLAAWREQTGSLDVIRCYPAGKTGTAGMSEARKAVEFDPTVPLVVSSLVTGRNVDVEALAREHQTLADKVNAARTQAGLDPSPMWAIMDAEPEHERGRAYTEAQWCDQFLRWADAHDRLAPSVEARVLNLTGYQFTKRIDRFAKIHGELTVIAVDPYWRTKASDIQAGEADLTDAVDWAEAHGVRTAWGEWGIDPGPGSLDRIDRAFRFVASSKPVFAPYFQLFGAWDSRLTTADDFAHYRAAATAAP